MTQYCSTLLVYIQYGTVLLCATCIYTQYGTVLLCITFTCRTWHCNDLHYVHTHNMKQCCSALLYIHNVAQYCSALLLHAWYGTVPLSVTHTCTSNALYYFYMPLTIAKLIIIVKTLHIAFQFFEVLQNIWWSCKQANTCKILGCHRGITEHTSLLGHNTVHCVAGCVVPKHIEGS